MKFEEILPLLRYGKAVRCRSYDYTGEYWQAMYQGLINFEDGGKSIIPETKILTLARFEILGKLISDSKSWGIPRWVVMSDEWESFK
jgi:hypothetical protein